MLICYSPAPTSLAFKTCLGVIMPYSHHPCVDQADLATAVLVNHFTSVALIPWSPADFALCFINSALVVGSGRPLPHGLEPRRLRHLSTRRRLRFVLLFLVLVYRLIVPRSVWHRSCLVVFARVVLCDHRCCRCAALVRKHIARLCREMVRTQCAYLGHVERVVRAHIVLGLDHGGAIPITTIE